MIKKSFVAVVIVFLFVFTTFIAKASDIQFISTKEVQTFLERGPLNGYFESVAQGTVIKRYPIEIKGIYNIGSHRVILFTSEANIAAGMSGSPSYIEINGITRLIGALAYGFSSFAKPCWGGITPIDEMLNGDPRAMPNDYLTNFQYQGMAFQTIPFGNKSIGSLEGKFFVYSQANEASAVEPDQNLSLRAGMPIFVELFEFVNKDDELNMVGALGTITYIDEETNRIWAFGHPFFDIGKVHCVFRTCEIIGIVDSESEAFKLAGKISPVLGLIDFDSHYAISGILSQETEKIKNELHKFTLEICGQNRQNLFQDKFEIRIANMGSRTPLLVKDALSLAGYIAGAPASTEKISTDFKVKINFRDYKPLEVNQTFSSEIMRFGPNTFYFSSFQIALDDFIEKVYLPLFTSNYEFKINNIELAAGFLFKKVQKLKLASYRFPNKIIWGEDPTVMVVFVSEDNSIAIKKSVVFKINWSDVEKPLYAKETKEIQKEQEKVVSGRLCIYSSDFFESFLTDEEKQLCDPAYFLNPENFLNYFSLKLQRTNKKIYAKVQVKARSGLFDEQVAMVKPPASDLIETPLESEEKWTIIQDGLNDREISIKDEGTVSFPFEFPSIPPGYIISKLIEIIPFEVVSEK